MKKKDVVIVTSVTGVAVLLITYLNRRVVVENLKKMKSFFLKKIEHSSTSNASAEDEGER